MTEPARPRLRLRLRHVGPVVVLGFVALTGILSAAASADSPTSGPSSGSVSSRQDTASTTSGLTNAGGGYGDPPGTPGSPVSYSLPPTSYVAAGKIVYEENCSSCHEPDLGGGKTEDNLDVPNIRGVGGATVDFYVSTGRMPLTNEPGRSSPQAERKNPRLTPLETLEVVAYVVSQGGACQGGVSCLPLGIPKVNLSDTNVSQGYELFVLNCAACHTILGAGDAISDNHFAPSLHKATPTQIAEALRIGPNEMPRFGPNQLSDQQVADIVSYVTGPIQRPDNRGGLGLGGIGPVAEGFIALLIGVGALMLVAFWLGDRA